MQRHTHTVVTRAGLCLGLLGFGVSACNHKAPAAAKLAGDDAVLAEVEGTQITKYDVELAIKSMFGESGAGQLDEASKKRVLESLVQSRAMASKRAQELSAQETAELERKVAVYREELLVKQYLIAHTKPEGVSTQMVEAYYAQHPEQFGGKHTRAYELIASTRELLDAERGCVITALKDPGAHKDWPAWVAELQKKNLPVSYQRGAGTDAVLHPSLQTLVTRLGIGESSALTFVQGRAYVLRVTGETQAPAKPLSEVSAEIRKTLVPVQLKKSVKEASDQVLKSAKVVYHGGSQG
jgi:hypothetical protein